MTAEIILLNSNPESFCDKLFLILIDKVILGLFALGVGYYITLRIEKYKSNQIFLNEIGKEKVKRDRKIAKKKASGAG